ncbi:hypothetical protein ERO13_D07G123433v2 [Gossypium hirsutum]|uniref:Uncharacterized protein n=1 Tax=Gossypium barbadense TaxID=3634 RepID=A0A5J5QTR2_GOSBA|nr:hypothetical protein ES319_D07G132300v1 [Gossypium barbadense]KAG4138251.1 hypothetical protein ERO13_D07G123433v2 [Gossypium hirsutum]
MPMILSLQEITLKKSLCGLKQSPCILDFKNERLRLIEILCGIEVTKSKKGIFLSRRKHVFHLLIETEKLIAKP